jgi:hypothetical protein
MLTGVVRPFLVLAILPVVFVSLLVLTPGDQARPANAVVSPAYSCRDAVASADSADVCSLATAYLIDSLRGLQASKLYQQWAKANPGEVRTFTTYLGSVPPNPWNPTSPLQAKMATPFGAMLRDLVSACKVLLCPPSVLPPVPPASAFPDTTPPSTPTGLVVR